MTAPDAPENAALLRVLAAIFNGRMFDEHSVARLAQGRPELERALLSLGCERGMQPLLSEGSDEIIAAWLKRIAGRPIGGLVLRRDKHGWCKIKGAGSQPAPSF
jgi:hypothetical protein